MRSHRSLLACCLLITLSSRAQWTFKGDTTATWEQAITRYEQLDRAHTGARLMEIGHDDDGSPIHVFVISDGSGFTPDSIRAAGKSILWITNGIHPGEPDGVDASLMLARALLESDQLMGLVVHTAVCIVPVYNVWGAKQREHASRPDQQGPTEHGIRANARNLDLNRDFIKMDAENTHALEMALNRWDPDVYFETHVSDGADHRYVMELLTTQKDKLAAPLGTFMTGTMVPELYSWMDRKGMLMCPYFETVKETPDSGLVAFYDPPRYSTGYNALFDRIGILSESHMLKPYAARVNATFQLMLATLAVMNKHASELAKFRGIAKAHTSSVDEFGFNWTLDTTHVDSLDWKGYAAGYEPSRITGLPRLEYDGRKPIDITVPWMETYHSSLTKRRPKAYLVPTAWAVEIEPRLLASGVPVERITKDTLLYVELSTITAFETGRSPFE
ncbi:MAG TPA: M14 family zinc carboxypeptidase, partial [Flavobacteriales bacterium]|nr:M14 family zinc carboxypeptidase [Flavobacteriales bacterium]